MEAVAGTHQIKLLDGCSLTDLLLFFKQSHQFAFERQFSMPFPPWPVGWLGSTLAGCTTTTQSGIF